MNICLEQFEEEKRGTRKWNGGAKVCALGNEKFKERTDSKWNKESGDLTPRPHLALLPTCEKELEKSLSSEGNQQQQKAHENVIEQGG